MYRSVLVPLDTSPFAEHALPFALSIARRSEAALQVVSVHPPLSAVYTEASLTLESGIEPELKCRERAYLDGVAQRLHAVSFVPVALPFWKGTSRNRSRRRWSRATPTWW